VNTLRVRLILAVLVTSLIVAAVIVIAVRWFSTEQIMHLLMEGVDSEAEARAMVDEYLGRVVVIGAVAGITLGGLTAWWLVLRVLRPLGRLTEGTRRVAEGDLATRLPEPPDTELREVAHAFNQMAATLERTEQLRRTLVEDVAHELRTPLTSLRGYTEALADGVIEPTPEMLRTIHAEIERLTRLVEGLDRLARNERAVARQARAEVDLGELVRGALALAAPELASRAISVRVEETADLPRLVADPDGIGQVVSNLVQNAARYTADGGDITVRLRTDGAAVLCAITNSGSEIPPDELPLIWERLHRVDRSRARATGGAGIGLAIVRQIVTAHGGEVGARSGDGRTEIWFRLPLGAQVAR
jgi:two-component system, OmpR family, sensor histidine kinase BaeS